MKEAQELLVKRRISKIVNDADIHSEAIRLAESSGIIFIDEIDKITLKANKIRAKSLVKEYKETFCRLLKALVNTKYGPYKRITFLFIASGAFHLSKPSDLIPELQGRFPIRVELDDLTADDFVVSN